MSEARRIYEDVMAESERRWKAEHAVTLLLHPPSSSNGDGRHDTDDQADTERDAEKVAADLFAARPDLAHIAQAARARRVAPLAVLGAVMARVAAFTPPNYGVPPLVGSHVPLTIYPTVIDPTGGGKSAGAAVARDLLCDTPPGCVGPVSLGTGEGLTELYLGAVDYTDDEGNKRTRRAQVRYGALVTLDEGRMLAELANRKGTTILATLCTAWTGGDLGQANADRDRFRRLEAGTYSLGMLTSWQPAKAAALFDDTDGGLPGRMLYLPGNDHHAPDHAPEWPGPLAWHPLDPPWFRLDGSSAIDVPVTRRPLDYPTRVAAEVDAARLSRLRGDTVHPLDAHRMLHRLKLAGDLAVLERRRTVTDTDWELSGVLLHASDLTRAVVVEHIRLDARQREDAANARAARRESVIADTAERRALLSGARAMARKAHGGTSESVTRAELSRAASSRMKALASVDEMLAHAIAEGWLEADGDRYRPGRSQPS